MKKILALDGIRGLACLFVLWAHFPMMQGGAIFRYFHLGSKVIYAGYIGVDIFFALSGFLITRILLWEKEHDKLSYSNFYFKRFLRIFPVYYLVILLVGLIISWKDLGWSALYLSNYYFSFHNDENPLRHTWSLCVEQHFYLFWPFLIKFFSIKISGNLVRYVIPAVAILSAIVSVYYMQNGVEFINRATNVRIFTLCLGASLAFCEKKIPSYNLKISILLTVLFLICMSACHFVKNVPLMAFGRFIFSAAFSYFFLLSLLIMTYTEKLKTVLGFFESSVMRFFGKISYGLYLFHLPILVYFKVSHMDNVDSVPLGKGLMLLGLCIIIPTISFYFFESPLLKIKNRYTTVKGQI